LQAQLAETRQLVETSMWEAKAKESELTEAQQVNQWVFRSLSSHPALPRDAFFGFVCEGFAPRAPRLCAWQRYAQWLWH
jgi:hypothetical protein